MKIKIQNFYVLDLYTATRALKTLDELQINISDTITNYKYIYQQVPCEIDDYSKYWDDVLTYTELDINYIKNEKLKVFMKKHFENINNND